MKKKNTWIGALLLSAIFVGCGDNESKESTERFVFETINGDTVEKDTQKKLMWVGSDGADGKACQKNPTADMEAGAIASAKEHCESLVFAGFDDWRVPTPNEMSEMIKGMYAAGKTPYYTVPSCPRLMGAEGTTAMAVNTHNSEPVGALIPWGTLLQMPKTNYGVKCVRGF